MFTSFSHSHVDSSIAGDILAFAITTHRSCKHLHKPITMMFKRTTNIAA